MAHQDEPPTELQKVPGHTRLYRRGCRYYIRAKVPIDLQSAMKKKEIKNSLKTSDYREAVRAVKLESAKLDALFDDTRALVHRGAQGKKPLASLSEGQAMQMVVRWFLEIESKSEEEYDADFGRLSEEEKGEILSTLNEDEQVYSGKVEGAESLVGTGELERLLRSNGITFDKKDALFSKLAALVRKGRAENTRRSMQRVVGDVPTETDKRVWQLVEQQTQKQAVSAETVSLGEMLKRYSDDLAKAKRSEATLKAYRFPIRVLEERLGKQTPLDTITRDDLAQVRDFLMTIPLNAAQRYKGKTLAQAVKAANAAGDNRRLDERTAQNYYNTICGIFSYAVNTRLLAHNPASDKFLRASFKPKKKQKAVFTAEQLNKMFKAPLYTGCQDDENGYAKKGIFRIRRGRFWVPLLALFHGLRSNEACQLYTEDVTRIDGVPCIKVRDSVDDGSETEKRLKTASSERTLPIHPELLKMGFLQYVERRRLDKKQHRLFPELTKGKAGKFSDPFQKWFGRFLKSSLGHKPKATFHSFRHMFRDALRRADVGIEKVEALGGWKHARSAEAGYGSGFPMPVLKAELAKVQYPSVFLGHLYREKSPSVSTRK